MANREIIDIIINAKDHASKVLQNLKSSIIGIGAAYLTLRGGAEILKATVGAAIESEKVYDALSDAIERHGGSWKNVETKVRNFTDQLRRTLGVSDEVVAQGLQKLIDAGLTTAKAMEAMKLATDMAAGAHMDLNSAIDLVAKASVGITRGLAQVNIKMEESGTAAERAEKAFALLNQKFGGAAADAMDTTISKLSLLTGAIGELGESIGDLFISQKEGGAGLLDILTNDIEVIAAFIKGSITFSEALHSLGARYDSLGNQVANNDLAHLLWLKTQRDLIALQDPMIDGVEDLTNKQAEWLKQQRDIIALQDETSAAISGHVDEITQKFYVMTPAVKAFYDEWVASGKRVYDELSPLQKKLLDEMEKEKNEAAKGLDFGGAIEGGLMTGLNNAIGQLEIFKTRAKTIFGQIAQDFFQFFVQEILRQVAVILVTKLLKLLHIFDVAANDRMAMQMGKDYAKFFTQGVISGINKANLSGSMALRAAPLVRAGFAGQPMGGGQTVNIYFSGPITNRDYVETEIIPVIEKAIVNKRSDIVYKRQPLTGKALVAF